MSHESPYGEAYYNLFRSKFPLLTFLIYLIIDQASHRAMHDLTLARELFWISYLTLLVLTLLWEGYQLNLRYQRVFHHNFQITSRRTSYVLSHLLLVGANFTLLVLNLPKLFLWVYPGATWVRIAGYVHLILNGVVVYLEHHLTPLPRRMATSWHDFP